MKTPQETLFPFIVIAWFIMCTLAIGTITYAQRQETEPTINDIAQEATLPSFYTQMIAEGKIQPRYVEKARIAEIQENHDLQKKHEQIMGEYYESQAPKETCISNHDRWLDDRVQYAYMLGGMDFVGTIASESMFDPNAKWDKSCWKNEDGTTSCRYMAHGFCQLHATWHSDKIREYKALGTNEEKLEYCYKVYKGYIDAWNIENRLYGYNVRNEGIKKLGIICN